MSGTDSSRAQMAAHQNLKWAREKQVCEGVARMADFWLDALPWFPLVYFRLMPPKKKPSHDRTSC